MHQQNISIGTLVDMYKRGELRLPEIQCHLESLCVSTDRAMWSTEAYRDFLKVRREALAQRMNAFIGEKLGT